MKALHTLALAALCLLFSPVYAANTDLTKFYIENRGQVQDEKGQAVNGTLFYLAGNGKKIFVTEKGYAIVQAGINGRSISYNTVEVQLEGATITRQNVIFGKGKQPSINFYKGSKVLEDVKTTNTVIVKNIYPGIDWLWSIDANGNPKHEFMVNVGADASLIKYKVLGAKLATKGNNITYSLPGFGVQEGPVVLVHNKGDINATLKVNGQQLSFNIPDELKQGGFTIDPSITTLWGDSLMNTNTEFTAIDVNDSMHTVTVGRSTDYIPVFPQVAGSYQSTHNLSRDLVIMKTDRQQNLVWATYFGGVDDDGANGVVTCPTGVFVTGYSKSWDFPQNILGNYTHPVQLFGQDAFVIKFDNLGKWKWSTGYGGSQPDEAFGIKYYNGKVYIAGYTESSDFPTLGKSGAYNSGPISSPSRDAFIVEFDTLGNRLWATCYGGAGNNTFTGLAVDAGGIFAVGHADGTIPLQANGSAYYQPVRKGQDGTLTKFSTAGALQWGTYFGSDGTDVASGIVHSSCGLFICGTTDSTGLPVLSQGNGNHYEPTYGGGGGDGFIAKFNANTQQQQYTTYYGSAITREVFTRMDINTACEAVITGYADSTIINTGNPNRFFIQPANYGENDVMMVQLTAQQHVQWSSLFGRGGNDYGFDVKYALNGAIDMVGANLYNYGNYLIGGTYTTTPCNSYYTCPRVTSNAVSNRFMNKDTSGFVFGNDSVGCFPLYFHSMLMEKNTCPSECNGRASMDTTNIAGCPPYTILWSSGGNQLIDTSLCEQYWSRIGDSYGRYKTLYNTFNVLKVPTSPTVETTCGQVFDWLDYIHPTGGGPPYTVTFRGISDSTCPTTAFFDVMDTAKCIVSHSLRWKRYNEGLYPALTIDNNCILNAAIHTYPFSCLRVDGGWNYVIIANGDTTRIPVTTHLNKPLFQVPDSSVVYTVYIDQGTCISELRQILSPGKLKDSIDATLICGDSLGKLDITVFPDTVTLNYAGAYTIYVMIEGDSGHVETQVFTLDADSAHTFHFDGLVTDRYLVRVFSNLNNNWYDGCQLNAHFYNLKSVQFSLNRASVYCGVSDTLIATMTGGFAPYYYQWSHTWEDSYAVDVFTPGFYSLTVTDSKGCTFDTTVSVPGSPALEIDYFAENLDPCAQGLFATAEVSATGGTWPYLYTWSSGEDDSTALFIPQGPNWVRVFDIFECSDTVNFVSTKKAGMNVDSSFTNVSCNGFNDGKAAVHILFGYPPFTIQWGNGATTDSIQGLAPGWYDYYVTDSTGCQVYDYVYIDEPPLLESDLFTGAAACTAANGSAQVSPMGGTTPIEIMWSDGNTLFARNDLTAGPHEFTVTDANGCTVIDTADIEMMSTLDVFADKYDATCSGESSGGVTVYLFNETQPITFEWSTGDNTEYLYNIPAGVYGYTVTDGFGCMYKDSVTIFEPDSFLIHLDVINPLLCNGDLATITVYAEGGTPPYTGMGNHTLAAGDYQYFISDYNGCQVDTSITITEPDVFESSGISTDATCLDLGYLDVYNVGGTAPYYAGMNSSYDNFTIYNLDPSEYEYVFTVVDGNGCTDTVTAFIGGYIKAQPSLTVKDVSCNGGNDGAITIIIEGGIAPFTINGIAYADSFVVQNLTTGFYPFTISDSSACIVEIEQYINEPSPLETYLDTSTGISCAGTPAYVSITADGGTPPYTGVGWQYLDAGAYSIPVTDSKGCEQIVEFTLTNPTTLFNNIEVIQPDCNNQYGELKINTTGGVGPYTAYFDGWMYDYNDNLSIPGIFPGSYNIDVYDQVGCYDFQTVTIEPYNLPVTDVIVTNVSCNGLSNGEISIDIVQGTAPFKIEGIPYTGTFTRSNLAAGFYNYEVTDSAGCASYVSEQVTQPAPLVAHVDTATGVGCTGTPAFVTITATGGTAPYSGVGSQNLMGGTYSIPISDSKGCVANANFVLAQPVALNNIIKVVQPDCNTGFGAIRISTTGGLGPYSVTFEGNSYPYTDSIAFNNLMPDGYNLTILDSKGCSQLKSAFINTYTLPVSVLSVTDVTCNGANDGEVSINIVDGTPPFKINGTLYSGSYTSANMAAGDYDFAVSDSAGCNVLESATIVQPAVLVANVDTGTGILCHGSLAYVTITATGGNAPYTGLGSYNLSGGTYNMPIVDDKGCFTNAQFSIYEPAGMNNLVLSTQPNCNDSLGSIIIKTTGGVGPYIIEIEGDSYSYPDTIFFYDVQPGGYNFTVTDGAGCSQTDNILINTYAEPVVTFSTHNVECHAENNGNIQINISQGIAPYYVEGLQFTSGNTINNLVAGDYEYDITDASGCGRTINFVISEPDTLIASYNITEGIICRGDSFTINVTAQGGTLPYTGTGSYTYYQGAYTETVTDAHGCTSNVSYTFTQPDEFDIAYTVTDPNCTFGNGTIKVIAIGGDGPYKLDNGTGLINFPDSITVSLAPGTHTYQVRDANGCTEVFSVVIANATTQTAISLTNALCYGDTNGTATIRITGSSAQFTLNGTSFTDSIVMPNLAAGLHQFNVTDASGCSFLLSGVVSEPDSLWMDNSMLVNGLTCYDRNDASILINPHGGTQAYTFGLVRAAGDTLRQANGGFSNIASGTYNVFVSDVNGCKATGSFVVDTFILSVDSISIDSIDCYGSRDGAIRVYPTPADRNPYTFSLNGSVPQVHNVFYGLTSGTYGIEVSDVNGCTHTVQVFIPQSDSIDSRVWLNGELLPVDSTLIVLRGEAVFTKDNTLDWEIIFNPDLHPTDAGDSMMTFKPRDPASYTVYVYQDSIGSSCYKQYTGFIDVESVPLLPDIITPNADGFNDMWAIDLEKYPNSKVVIFDRWGAIVYETDAYQNDWNGTYQKGGAKVVDGTYFYLLTPNGDTKVLKGAINVLNSQQ